jgi:hypothetical protein
MRHVIFYISTTNVKDLLIEIHFLLMNFIICLLANFHQMSGSNLIVLRANLRLV